MLCQRSCMHRHHPCTPLLTPLTLLQLLRQNSCNLLLLLHCHLPKCRHLGWGAVVQQRAYTASFWLRRSHHRRAMPARLRSLHRRSLPPCLFGFL